MMDVLCVHFGPGGRVGTVLIAVCCFARCHHSGNYVVLIVHGVL